MKVKCLTNFCKDLPNNLIRDEWGYKRDSKFEELTIGKEYIVYAISVMEDYFWYCLADDYNLYYPVFKPCTIFEIVDPKLSKYWQIAYNYYDKIKVKEQLIAYKEWAQEENYYGLLTDGNEREVEIYKKYKKLMEQELE